MSRKFQENRIWGTTAFDLSNDHPPSWIVLSIRKQWLLLVFFFLYLFIFLLKWIVLWYVMPIIPFAAVYRLHFCCEWDFSDSRARVKCDPQQKPKHTTVERWEIAMCSENSRDHSSVSRRSCHANTSYWSKVSNLDYLDISIGSFLDHSSIFKEKRHLSTGMLEIFCKTILALHRNIQKGDFQGSTALQHCRENFRITACLND